MHGTAKIYKFNNIENIALFRLQFRPTIVQSGTYTYNAAQVIVVYLKPLWSDN